MTFKEKLWSFILLLGTLLTEIHSVLIELYPDEAAKELNLFLQPDGTFSIQVSWYLKSLSENLLWLLVFYAFTRFKTGFSWRFSLILVTYLIYHTFDFISFLYNFKHFHRSYWVVLLLITISQLFIIFGKRNNLRVIKP